MNTVLPHRYERSTVNEGKCVVTDEVSDTSKDMDAREGNILLCLLTCNDKHFTSNYDVVKGKQEEGHRGVIDT